MERDRKEQAEKERIEKERKEEEERKKREMEEQQKIKQVRKFMNKNWVETDIPFSMPTTYINEQTCSQPICQSPADK